MNVNVDDGYTPNRFAKFKRPTIPSNKPKTVESQGLAGTSRLGDEDEKKGIAVEQKHQESFGTKLAIETQKVQQYRHEPVSLPKGAYPRLGQYIDVFV